MTAPATTGPVPDATGLPDIDRVRAAVRSMQEALLDSDLASADDPEVRLVGVMIDLIALAADDAAGVEAMNARTRERADRVGGDGHTWVMHRREWSLALQAVAAWEEIDRA